MPKISLITTFYNAEKTISDTIKSVLNQTYKDFEHILVDDGSTDSTADIIHNIDSSLKIFKPGRIGRANALNYAINKSTSEYIAILDADDICLENKLEVQNKILDNNKDISLTFSNAYYFNNENKNIGVSNFPLSHDDNVLNFKSLNPFPASSAMYRRKDFLETRGYNAKCLKSLDFNLYLEFLLNHKKFSGNAEPLIKVRVDDQSWGKNDNESLQFRYGIIGLINYNIEKNFVFKSLYDYSDNDWCYFLKIYDKWFLKMKFHKKNTSKKFFNKARLNFRDKMFLYSFINFLKAFYIDPKFIFYRGIGFNYEKDIKNFLANYDIH